MAQAIIRVSCNSPFEWPEPLRGMVSNPLSPSRLSRSRYLDTTANKQRLEYTYALHNFSTLYDYSAGKAWYFYRMFNTYVCYTQPLVIPQLRASPLANATFSGELFPRGSSLAYSFPGFHHLTTAIRWGAGLPDVYLTWLVARALPNKLVSFSQGLGLFDANTFDMTTYHLGPPPASTWIVPGGEATICPPWPGAAPLPPP